MRIRKLVESCIRIIVIAHTVFFAILVLYAEKLALRTMPEWIKRYYLGVAIICAVVVSLVCLRGNIGKEKNEYDSMFLAIAFLIFAVA